MAKFWTCEKCGSNLDFGERCTCSIWVEITDDIELPFDDKPQFTPLESEEQLTLFPIIPKRKKRK